MFLTSNLIIILFFMGGFLGAIYTNTKTYQDLAEEHLKDIVSLADNDILYHIDTIMSKPVMVSKTMANDEFLKGWLLKEPEKLQDDVYLNQLYQYLKAYQLKYDYTTVFCVSAQTGNYYYQNGLNKTISESDTHDVWYYNFIASNREYDLVVDTNETHDNTVTIFINFRVTGENGELLGVIGVGLQSSFIENTIHSYAENYDLSVYIINAGGTETSYTSGTDIFINPEDLAERTGISDQIAMTPSADSQLQWFTSGSTRKCLITNYVDTLGWYLILEKDTASISSTFQKMIIDNAAYMLISLAVCIIVTTTVFVHYRRRTIKIENTDELTGLWNRKLFFRQYSAFIRKYPDQEKTLFMFDIDHFKNINDTYGHLFGNAVLAKVADRLRKTIDGYGIAARWGGDEFLGILTVTPKEAQEILGRFMSALKNEEDDTRCRVTVSIGIVRINEAVDAEQMLIKADEALYLSKTGGRDRITELSLL